MIKRTVYFRTTHSYVFCCPNADTTDSFIDNQHYQLILWVHFTLFIDFVGVVVGDPTSPKSKNLMGLMSTFCVF